MIVRGYRKDDDGNVVLTEIIDINELTYTGKDMGERSVSATVKFPTPIDFQIGDYVEIDISTLQVNDAIRPAGEHALEKFYLYKMPSIKKISSPMSSGDAFEHTLMFYPRQYELSYIMMRDVLQENSVNQIVYTGFGEFSFYGGAMALAERIKAVLDAFQEATANGDPITEPWNIHVSDAVNEYENSALERYEFSFSSTTVMDALLMLTNEENVNTTFYITGREIWIGYKRPTVCAVDENNAVLPVPYIFRYGKTSHRRISYGEGGLFTLTKVVQDAVPITKLYVYGGNRNLNRFYCTDRLKTGRYVDKLMLPSFSADGKTDFILSESGIRKYGIREGVKTYDDIYPSLRFMTYGGLRRIKYVVKIMGSGLETDGATLNLTSSNPLARIQCYRVEENGPVNTLVKAYPPKPIAVFIHALNVDSKRIQCVLYPSLQDQSSHDSGHVPVDRAGNPIVGSCFAVHAGKIGGANGYENLHQPIKTTSRDQWFQNLNNISDAEERAEVALFQVNYSDTFWVSDVFEFEDYEQTKFNRENYSAYCYPRVNKHYPASQSDNIRVDEVVEVDDVREVDTYWNQGTSKEQATFQIYLRDVGFKINEQTPFGDNAFVINGEFNINFTDGFLAGLTFNVTAQNGSGKDNDVVAAYNPDGTENPAFEEEADNPALARKAKSEGAYWRITCRRNDSDKADYGLILPSATINAHSGDHIVFLNIYMPDVYIEAAELRMQREAQRYLNNNDNAGVEYSVDTDKVRLQQVPALALQLREGVTMRVKDADLEIATDNERREIYDGSNTSSVRKSVLNPVPTYVTESFGAAEFIVTNQVTIETYPSRENAPYGIGEIVMNKTDKIVTRIHGRSEYNARVMDVLGGTDSTRHQFVEEFDADVTSIETIMDEGVEKTKLIVSYSEFVTVLDMTLGSQIRVTKKYSMKQKNNPLHLVNTTIDITYAVYESAADTLGKEYKLYDSNALMMLSDSKYYTVLVDVPAQADADLIPFSPTTFRFALMYGIGEATTEYFPELISTTDVTDLYEDVAQGMQRIEYRFYLPATFDDSANYYVGYIVTCDGLHTMSEFRVVKVVESNVNADGESTDYVDLVLDQVSIKYTNSKYIGAQDINDKQEIFREITATVKEQQHASAWASLMNVVETSRVLGEQTERTLESFATIARRRFRNIAELRESIFDPDGTITDVFLQTMMVQVGADSMNYALDNTRIFNGTMRNVVFNKDEGSSIWTLEMGADTLRHYVYTDGPHAGTWRVEAMTAYEELDSNERYYIAIKADKTASTATWIVTSTPQNVDSIPGYWVFNYGIVLSGDTARTIMETRGNAYMYGDNIICGKISTQDGQSYIDLSGNEVKFGSGLEYKGGMLKVGDTFETNGSGVAVKGVLSMKNQSNVVQSGISGKSDDNILIWGGGTYANALWAKDHNYKIEARNPAEIMTLIKRDGTGKIGIFRILQNSVQVFDENGDLKVEITNDELGNVIPSRTQWFLNKSNIYAPLIGSGTNLIVGSSPVCESNGTIMISYVKVSVSNVKVMNASGTAVAGSVYFNINAMNNNQVKLGELGGISQISVTSAGGGSGSSTLERTFIYETIRNMTYSITIEPVVTGGTQVSFYYTIYVESFFAENYSPRTIIAKDGLASIADGNHYFVVKNSNRHQQVIMHGLPSWADGTDEGGLYRKADGTIAISQYHSGV